MRIIKKPDIKGCKSDWNLPLSICKEFLNESHPTQIFLSCQYRTQYNSRYLFTQILMRKLYICYPPYHAKCYFAITVFQKNYKVYFNYQLWLNSVIVIIKFFITSLALWKHP